ncbi:hypothetical protein QIJ13_gp4 [ssRNA phage Esthiorhiza.4_4]|uniref:Uncharacterized protein n=2 Tax=Norzivirales TaxID=2842247 RepID=A0A8S5KZ29_9VIRU|nr:hypothetical protein QIJ13_gp4 [ssRNA phage Esthiorhiza.4_4]QDH90887.1 MAG: hypothetical protein H4RhizoLitter20158_000004 [Leviviridae sp.]DAD50317.1 TPA_asm: hypothetical protein [ssRNA phage Esthiorhiza.4_4]
MSTLHAITAEITTHTRASAMSSWLDRRIVNAVDQAIKSFNDHTVDVGMIRSTTRTCETGVLLSINIFVGEFEVKTMNLTRSVLVSEAGKLSDTELEQLIWYYTFWLVNESGGMPRSVDSIRTGGGQCVRTGNFTDLSFNALKTH